MPHQFSKEDVSEWDVDSVAGWLKGLQISAASIGSLRENDVNGAVLLELDDGILEELGVGKVERARILESVAKLETGEAASSDKGASSIPLPWSSDSEDESTPDPVLAASGTIPGMELKEKHKVALPQKRTTKLDKKHDPLRLAANSKAVADLADSTVASGFLWKVGGSGMKLKHWKKRFFVLTDDNCLYYFKSPKELSALGMIMLPSYTITLTDKHDNPGNRPYAFKAFNREHAELRSYVFAADDTKEMKTWMNVMSLASIAYGTGEASLTKSSKSPKDLSAERDEEFELMQKRASERAGGVQADKDAIDATSTAPSAAGDPVPTFLKKTLRKGSKTGPTLCIIKLLDGNNLQLYAESATTGQDFLDQICTMINAHEKYYFGIEYTDSKGDIDWISEDKKILKHDISRTEDGHLELKFRIRFMPLDVTQVLQYVTLYQVFLSARQDVLDGNLDVSNKDAITLASLALQASRGDFADAADLIPNLAKTRLIPESNAKDILQETFPKPQNKDLFFAEEVVRIWKSLQGILRHLAVLRYMQIVQKHPRFAMQYFDVKNKKGTALIMGVNPHGLFLYRDKGLHKPVVQFSWAECSELAFTDKKFSIQVHNRETKAFSVYTNRSKTCQRILDLCIGLHRLYVQQMHNWENAPADFQAMRKSAIDAALVERDNLKIEAQEARKKAKEVRRINEERKAASPAKAAAAPAAAPTPAPAPAPVPAPAPAPVAETPAPSTSSDSNVLTGNAGEKVYIKGRMEAVQMLDMIMADEEFMRFQDELMEDFENSLLEEIESGGRMRTTSFLRDVERPIHRSDIDTFEGELEDRAEYVGEMDAI